MSHSRIIPVVLVVLSVAVTYADSVSPNWTHVQCSTTDGTAWHGDRYAKCIPAEDFGSKGKTLVYHVTKGRDELEDTYDWYATTVYLAGTGGGTSLVRMGPWSEGHEPNGEQLALAFYWHGKLLKQYSTLEIAKSRENVRRTVSHYEWKKRVIGYCWLKSDAARVLVYGFALETIDGRVLGFDVKTGKLMEGWRPE